MKGHVVSAYTKDGDRLYLSNLDVIHFSNDIVDAISFETIDEAKSTLDNRYLSLSYCILNMTKKKELEGIYIVKISDGRIIEDERRYL